MMGNIRAGSLINIKSIFNNFRWKKCQKKTMKLYASVDRIVSIEMQWMSNFQVITKEKEL